MNREKQEYLARAFGCGIHEGDIVRVLRAWTEEEGAIAGCNWDEYLDSYIGEAGIVSEILVDGAFEVEVDDEYLYTPYFVLEKVEDH